MKVICRDHQRKAVEMTPEGRAVSSVSSDIDRLLAPKTFEELEVLEKQIFRKLNSDEPIDVDYWEQLLRSLTVWKARATLKKVYQSVIASRLEEMRKQQQGEAEILREKLQVVLDGTLRISDEEGIPRGSGANLASKSSQNLDPEPLLKIRGEDKGLEVQDESSFLAKVVCH